MTKLIVAPVRALALPSLEKEAVMADALRTRNGSRAKAGQPPGR